MMEFNLSEKIVPENDRYYEKLYATDVKEFIRLLKEEIEFNIAGSDKFYNDNPDNLLKFIDKLAGDKLK